MSGPDTVATGTERRLRHATRPFAVETTARSWWHVSLTAFLLLLGLGLAAAVSWWPARLVASVFGGLMIVRAFALFHDFMHGSLLRKSRLAKTLFYSFGFAILTPPLYWRRSHNFHHAHVGKPAASHRESAPLVTSDIGTFPLITTLTWQGMSGWQRLRYRASRHPLTLLGGYATVFLYSMCLDPLLKDPRKHWDAGVSLLIHGGIIAGLWFLAGLPTLLFAFLLPLTLSCATGAYLFYAQHNCDGLCFLQAEEWTHDRGSLESSSYLELGPVMNWFTANIGYHHIHHLNSRIPFYRLPETMAALGELQHPQVTSFRPRQIGASLRLNLWDPDKRQLVGYREAPSLSEGHNRSKTVHPTFIRRSCAETAERTSN